MATIDREDFNKWTRTDIVNAVHVIAGSDIDQLTRDQELGRDAYSFEPLRSIFEKQARLFSRLQEIDVYKYPKSVQKSFLEVLWKTLLNRQNIAAFDPKKVEGSADKIHEQLISSALAGFDNTWASLMQIITYDTIEGIDAKIAEAGIKSELQAEQLAARVSKTSDAAEDLLTSAKIEYEQTSDEVKKLMKMLRDEAAKGTVSQHSEVFDEQAKSNRKRAYVWLAVTAALIGILAWLASDFAEDIVAATVPTDTNTKSGSGESPPYRGWIALVASNTVLYSVLYFALVSAVRNYSAHWHNHVVNRHRHNALQTFETFREASDDPETRNAVLLAATSCIFTPQVSGFSSKEAESSPSPQILELVRHVTGGSKS